MTATDVCGLFVFVKQPLIMLCLCAHIECTHQRWSKPSAVAAGAKRGPRSRRDSAARRRGRRPLAADLHCAAAGRAERRRAARVLHSGAAAAAARRARAPGVPRAAA